MKTEQTFAQAMEAMKEGKFASRAGWNGKGLFVFSQVPAVVAEEVVPRMQWLPELVKAELTRRGGALRYSNHFALVHPDNLIEGWAPSVSDCLAKDWIIFEEPDPLAALADDEL